MEKNLSFGELVQKLRKDKGWTVREFIERLCPVSAEKEKVSPSYITRIEQYDEIPSPEVMLKIAEILEYDVDTLWKYARAIKVKKFEYTLDKKYQEAFGLCRTQKK